MAVTDRLHCVENGQKGDVPIVFLHGFGGICGQWASFQHRLSHRHTLAFDLPGHGRSLDFDGAGPPKVAARAVIDELQRRGIDRAHIVGHSMGGAIAGLMVLLAPTMIVRATFLAPGGFGKEINRGVLFDFLESKTLDEMKGALTQFYGPGFFPPDDGVLAYWNALERPGARQKLGTIADILFAKEEQGVLPLDAIAATGVDLSVFWGEADVILPVSQAENLPDAFVVHILPGVGHVPQEEAEGLILHQVSA